MNNAKMRIVEAGQTSVARKVLSAIPIQERWSAKQIVCELARLRTPVDSRTVGGCLNSLISSGLVREAPPGQFQRVPYKGEKPVQTEREPTMRVVSSNGNSGNSVNDQKKHLIDPLDHLGRSAVALKNLGKTLQELAVEIEEAALAMAEKCSNSDGEIAKLRQLQELLKSLGK